MSRKSLNGWEQSPDGWVINGDTDVEGVFTINGSPINPSGVQSVTAGNATIVIGGTVSDPTVAVNVGYATGAIPVVAGGTPSSSTYLDGTGHWTTPPGGSVKTGSATIGNGSSTTITVTTGFTLTGPPYNLLSVSFYDITGGHQTLVEANVSNVTATTFDATFQVAPALNSILVVAAGF